MLKPLFIETLRTSSLRAPRASYFGKRDFVATSPRQSTSLLGKPQSRQRIMHHPTVGWNDDYDINGLHYSRRLWNIIMGGRSRISVLRDRCYQERKFRYAPAIPWKENPAYWDGFLDDLEPYENKRLP